MIPSLTCPARQSIRILSRTVKHLRTVHVQLFPRKTVSTMNKTYVFGKTSVMCTQKPLKGTHTKRVFAGETKRKWEFERQI